MTLACQHRKLFLLILLVFVSESTYATTISLKRRKSHATPARGIRKMKKGKAWTNRPSISPIETPTVSPSVSPSVSPTQSPSTIPSPETIPATGKAGGGSMGGENGKGGTDGNGVYDFSGETETGGPPMGGSNSNVATQFKTPPFLLKFTLGQNRRFRERTRYLEETSSTGLLNEYRKEFLAEKVTNFLDQVISITCSEVTQEDNTITAQFGEGDAEVMATAPPSSGQSADYILAAFNQDNNKEMFLSIITGSEDEALKKVIDVEAILSDSETLNNDGEVRTFHGRKSGNFITIMFVGIFAVTATVSAIYHHSRRRKRSREGCELSEYYNNNDSFDEDANPRSLSVEEMLSPHSSWSNTSANSLEDIALSSVSNDADISSKSAPSPWNMRKMSMSKLAAGATQDEFAQNGMCVDTYGQLQNGKKKRKKNSPVINAKKGSELDTNLDPIVEVSSSVASSLVSQTDDKMVKGTSEIPKLLPALSISSCPSDEGNYQGCVYSPVDAPALTALSPDTLMSDSSMTPAPYDTPLTSKSLHEYTSVSPSSDEGSPIRRLSFQTNEYLSEGDSDRSSDSGVRDLLACQKMDTENVVVMSEDEALKASLITFVDDESKNSRMTHVEQDDKDIIRRTLGFVSDDDDEKENSPPSINGKIENSSSEGDYNATILVLGQTQN